MLPRFWVSRKSTIRSSARQQDKLGLVMEKKVTVLSVPKSDNRVEFGLGFSDKLLRTSLNVVWELMKQHGVRVPMLNADSMLRVTHGIQRELKADINLRDLNTTFDLMITTSRSSREKNVELPGWGAEDWVKPGCCLTKVSRKKVQICGGLDCVKRLAK